MMDRLLLYSEAAPPTLQNPPCHLQPGNPKVMLQVRSGRLQNPQNEKEAVALNYLQGPLCTRRPGDSSIKQHFYLSGKKYHLIFRSSPHCRDRSQERLILPKPVAGEITCNRASKDKTWSCSLLPCWLS